MYSHDPPGFPNYEVQPTWYKGCVLVFSTHSCRNWVVFSSNWRNKMERSFPVYVAGGWLLRWISGKLFWSFVYYIFITISNKTEPKKEHVQQLEYNLLGWQVHNEQHWKGVKVEQWPNIRPKSMLFCGLKRSLDLTWAKLLEETSHGLGMSSYGTWNFRTS